MTAFLTGLFSAVCVLTVVLWAALVAIATGAFLDVATREMSAETRQRLLEHFAPHNERLERLLGVDLDWDR